MNVIPIRPTSANDCRWLRAISAAVKAGARHSTDCAAAGKTVSHGRAPMRAGCPWCDTVAAELDRPPEAS